MTLFDQLGVIRYTRQKAEAFAQQALDHLAALPESPAKQSLREMAQFAVQRAY